MIDWSAALRVSLLGGFLSLDGTALLQVMISEPLPACCLVGLFTGQPAAGVIMGIAFQLLFISDLPVGSHLPKDAALLSLSALGAALVCAGRKEAADPDILAAAALLAVALEPLFSWSNRLVRGANRVFTPLVRHLIETGRYRTALAVAQGGLLLFWLRGAAGLLAFSLGGGALLALAVRRLPADILGAAHWAFAAFPLVGASHFLGSLHAGGLRSLGLGAVIRPFRKAS